MYKVKEWACYSTAAVYERVVGVVVDFSIKEWACYARAAVVYEVERVATYNGRGGI